MTARGGGKGARGVPQGSRAVRRDEGGRLRYPRPEGVTYPSETPEARRAAGLAFLSAMWVGRNAADAADYLAAIYPTKKAGIVTAILAHARRRGWRPKKRSGSKKSTRKG
jgi:hypothetical protein